MQTIAQILPDDNTIANLMERVTAGDQVAFSKLFSMYYKRLTSFAYSITKSHEAAEEIVEDIFLKLWTNRKTISSIQNPSVYLYVSVKNRSLNKLADKAREFIIAPFDDIDPYLEAIHQDPYTMMITDEMLRRVNDAINQLPPRCKMIFKLIREDGLKYKEVAEILNISINTIDAQMAIAVKRICEAIGYTIKKLKPSPRNILS